MSNQEDYAFNRRPEYMQQIAGFIHAVQYLRFPIIIVNILVVAFKLLVG